MAQADLCLEAEYLALQDSLNAAKAEIEAQKSKIMGSFTHAKTKLAAVSEQGAQLVGKTEIRKQEIKAEIAGAQAELALVMEENMKLLEMVPKGKEGKEALEAMKSDLEAINESAAQLPMLLKQRIVDGANQSQFR